MVHSPGSGRIGSIGVVGVENGRGDDLPVVVQAGSLQARFPRPAQHGKQQRRQNGNDGNHHQQLHQGECASRGETHPS